MGSVATVPFQSWSNRLGLHVGLVLNVARGLQAEGLHVANSMVAVHAVADTVLRGTAKALHHWATLGPAAHVIVPRPDIPPKARPGLFFHRYVRARLGKALRNQDSAIVEAMVDAQDRPVDSSCRGPSLGDATR